MTRYLLLILAFLEVSSAALAKDRFFIEVKQEEKAKGRWSLAEWLEQRDRMRLMDLWLALHSPSPYEFYVGGAYQTGRFSSTAYYSAWEASAAAYASIFGLELRNEDSLLSRRTTGLVHFRIFGLHAQATNLTLQGGVKHEERGGASLWNPLLGATLTGYLNRFFGVEAYYRHFFPSTSNGLSVAGDRFEAGAFIDFSFVRVYVDYFTESETSAPALSRSGGTLGTRIFF